MHRRSLLLALPTLASLSVLGRAQADSMPGPPPPALDVRVLTPSFEGTPRELRVEVRNPSGEVASLQPLRLLVRDRGLRFPLHVTSVEAEGQALPSTLAPGAVIQLRILFDSLPVSVQRRARLTFILRVGYAGDHTFTLRRAG